MAGDYLGRRPMAQNEEGMELDVSDELIAERRAGKPGETPEAALIRELKEETGLDPLNIFIADHVSKFYETNGDRINLVPVFGIEVGSKDVILSEEHVDFKWVDYTEAKNTLVWNGQKTGLKVVTTMIDSGDERLRWSKINF